MNTIKSLVIMSMLALATFSASAQQDAMFTHYMNNTLAVNPGYAGSRDALTGTLLHRSQWVGFKGAPTTQTLTLHTPFMHRNLGVGLSLINDKAGPIQNFSAYIDIAYILKVGEKSKLSFGVKSGVNLMQANLTSVGLQDPSDISFQENINSRVLPNFGTGLYYFRDRFYLGISAPKLLENNFITNQTKILKQQRHYFLIAGKIFRISDKVEFKPTTFIKATIAAPLEADLTTTFIFNNKLLLGAMFRTGDALGALIGFNITDQLYAGYSFDYSYGIRTFKYNNGSHEIILRYDCRFFEKQKVHSPRYF